MATLFNTPFRQAISPLENKIRKKIQGITCAELQAKGIQQCVNETVALIDLVFPTIGNDITYSDGGARGPYFIVLATVPFTGSHELLDFRPTNHFLRLPTATLEEGQKSILFPCAIEQGQSTGDVVQIATKELEFVNFYLQNLNPEWEDWKASVVVEVTNFLNDKDATCKARSNFIDALNN